MTENNKYNLVVENPESTVVAEYMPAYRTEQSYQSEAELEKAFIEQLQEQAHELLGLSNRFRVEIQNAFNFLSAKEITESTAASILNDLFSYTDEDGKIQTYGSRIRENILNIYGSSVGGQDMPTCRGTAFGLYNAISFYYDNVREYKNEDRRAASTWIGGAAKVRQRAFNRILQEVS